MKKKYVKPEFIFEDFSLNTTIAGGCGTPTKTPSYGQCGIDFSGLKLFLDTVAGCTDIQVKDEDLDGDEAYNGICYHVFSNGSSNFNS